MILPDWTLPSLVAHLPQEGEGIEHHIVDEREYLVAYRENAIAASLMFNPASGQVVGFVMPGHRRQGVGTELWRAGVERWGLEVPDEVTPDGEAFFASL